MHDNRKEGTEIYLLLMTDDNKSQASLRRKTQTKNPLKIRNDFEGVEISLIWRIAILTPTNSKENYFVISRHAVKSTDYSLLTGLYCKAVA